MVQRRTSTVAAGQDEHAPSAASQPLVDIINRADRGTERMLLEGLDERDPIAEQIRALMFVFEDITTLDDRAIQLVLRGVETADLATALKGVRDTCGTRCSRTCPSGPARTCSRRSS